MEAPIRIQAPHSHLFRGHSYPNDIYRNRDSRSDDDMPPLRTDYEGRRNNHRGPYSSIPERQQRPYRESDYNTSPPPVLLPHHNSNININTPQHLPPTRHYDRSQDYPRDQQSRIGIPTLVHESAIPTNTTTQRSEPRHSPYRSQVTSTPMSPPRSLDQDTQSVQLPGVGSVSTPIVPDTPQRSMENPSQLLYMLHLLID